MSYNVSSFMEMSQLEHLRHNTGMWVGDTETATHLLEELLDNSLDEVQQGKATLIGIFIDTKEKTFKVLDNGRGFPFDQSLPIEKDPPVFSATKMFTSAKFKKGDKDENAYGIAVGLHGIGLVTCFALSEWMSMEIYRDGLHGTYNFKHDGSVERSQEPFTKSNIPFATKVEVKPSPLYFTETSIDLKLIEERLLIAAANYPNLKVGFVVDGENKIIKGSEQDLILNHIGKEVSEWFTIGSTKGIESYNIEFAWDDQPPSTPKTFTTVNLCKVNEGAHINRVLASIRKYFSSFVGKTTVDGTSKYSFQSNDCMYGFRLYINLKIIKASYAEQIKKKLSTQSDLSVMEDFETKLEAFFKANPEKLTELLESFQAYRNSLTNKKLVGASNTGQKRGMTALTRLRDCKFQGGELIICEGASAGGGLIRTRNPNNQAILPLKGVIPNAITKQDFHKNKELKDIIVACGCGIDEHCDISKLRYSKIIIAADADPAGHWITALLITLFAYKMAPVVKAGKLYVCMTPLYGFKEKGVYRPLWTEEDVDKARQAGKKILRAKGLGAYDPKDLKVFTLIPESRKIIQIKWSETKSERLFDLMSNSEARKQLVMGEWTL